MINKFVILYLFPLTVSSLKKVKSNTSDLSYNVVSVIFHGISVPLNSGYLIRFILLAN